MDEVSVLFSEPKIPQSARNCAVRAQACSVSVLFSEPKIPQCPRGRGRDHPLAGFSALQRAENSSIKKSPNDAPSSAVFQCSSASRKFLNDADTRAVHVCNKVSVLFSEPKIPQWATTPSARLSRSFQCSSASRKFLNRRRLRHRVARQQVSVLFSEPKIPQSALECRWRRSERFQCSSASRKFLNQPIKTAGGVILIGFSALQRAENSSMGYGYGSGSAVVEFQCSSASRKFLNVWSSKTCTSSIIRFQCSSASRKFLNVELLAGLEVQFEFQCSSASRKFLNPADTAVISIANTRFSALQRAENSSIVPRRAQVGGIEQRVSVLFSEPKIPQLQRRRQRRAVPVRFSALQRAENSSMVRAKVPITQSDQVSVLFSEPKIPQCVLFGLMMRATYEFQCSSASRKFLNVRRVA